jgi:hypothetical protein
VYLCVDHVIFAVLKLTSNIEKFVECLFSFNFLLKKMRLNFAFWDTFKPDSIGDSVASAASSGDEWELMHYVH